MTHDLDAAEQQMRSNIAQARADGLRLVTEGEADATSAFERAKAN
jgi:hypothetical protein